MKHKLKQLRKFSPMLAGLVFLLLIIAIGWLLVRSALVNGVLGAATAVDETEGTYVVTQLALPEAAATETTEVATAVTPAIDEPEQTAKPTAATTAEPTQP